MQHKMNILGIDMDCMSYKDMYPLFTKWLADKDAPSHTMGMINVNCCVSALFDRKLRALYNSADIVGIDSMPFLHWARLFYNRKSDRFYAPDLMLEIAGKAKENNYSFFLYGGYPGTPDSIEQYLTKRYDGVKIVGKYSPPFRQLTDEEENNVIKMINDVRPDFLWVGLGSPKQDIWIQKVRTKIRGSVIIPSGATFDFFSGRIKQAPKWIRSIGLEWLFRLTQDFRRLWIRYTIYNLIFIVVFILQRLRIVRFKTGKPRENNEPE